MASPSLAMNLSVDPFRFNAPQRRAETPMPRMDGFSDDGLSYEVARDFSKLASQALAEYEARIKNPRNDIWGRTLREDTPAALDAELFAPLRATFGGSTNPSAGKSFEVGNSIIQQNPMTGAFEEVFRGQPAPKAPAATPRYSGPVNTPLPGFPPQTARLTAQEWASMAPGLPQSVTTNQPVASYIDWGRQSNAAPVTATAPMMPQPQIFMGNPAAQPNRTNTGPAVIRTGSGNVFKVTPR